jgi:hypothetical protein
MAAKLVKFYMKQSVRDWVRTERGGKTYLGRDKLETTELAPCLLVNDVLDNRIYVC